MCRFSYYSLHYFYLILEALSNYLTGSWQWWRFIIGTVILAITSIFTYTEFLRNVIDNIHSQLYDILPAIGFTIFVLSMELWIWYMRLKFFISKHIYTELSRESCPFKLTRHKTPSSDIPEEDISKE